MAGERQSPVTPRLRFPKFQKRKGWEATTLGSVADFYKGRGISKAEVESNGSRPCIRYGELYTRYGEVIDHVFSRTNAPAGGLFLSRVNDVIIPASGETKLEIAKASCVMLDDVALGSDLNVIRTSHNGVFLSYLLNSAKKLDIARVAQGHTVVHLYPSQLELLSIALPEKDEQQAVANCLVSLDNMIGSQGQMVEALRVHKRGLMQQIFPREGETFPRLRFPEFRDAPVWDERAAANFFANRIEKGEAELPIYSVTITDGLVRRSSLDRTVDDIAEAGGNKRAHRGDIAYNMMRMWQGASGVASEDCMVSPAYVVLSAQEGVHSDFYGYLLKLPKYLRLLTSHSQGLTKDRLRLYYKDFARIPLPRLDFREQEKVANALLSIDNLIAAETEKLDALEVNKQGLMQQLFPFPNGN